MHETFVRPRAEQTPRFFTETHPDTIAGVMRAPLHLEHPPYYYNPYSPTPLDPLMLYVNGYRYDDLARDYMENWQTEKLPLPQTAEEVEAWRQFQLARYEGKADAENHSPLPLISEGTWHAVAREIVAQHELKGLRNDAALRELTGDDTPVTKSQAERLMRLRAGIGNVASAFKLLALRPEVGGIEVMKATRPFSHEEITQAHTNLVYDLLSVDHPAMEVEVLNEAPYRRIEVDDPRIVVMKARLAVAAVRGVLVEVITRSAHVILDPNNDDMRFVTLSGEIAGHRVHMAEIGVTGYARPINSRAPHGDRINTV